MGYLEDQVVVVAEEAVREHAPLGLERDVREQPEEVPAIFIVHVDGLMTVSARADVADHSGALDAAWSGHAPRMQCGHVTALSRAATKVRQGRR